MENEKGDLKQIFESMAKDLSEIKDILKKIYILPKSIQKKRKR